MASENDNTEQRTSSSDSAPAFGSCRRKKNFRSGSFVSDLRDHVHEFLHASADEHRTCLKDTIQKMFRTSKAVGEKSSGRIEASAPASSTAAAPPPPKASSGGSGSLPPPLPGSTVVPFTTMQAAVSKNMAESLSVPTFRVCYPVTTDALDALYDKAVVRLFVLFEVSNLVFVGVWIVGF
ncbi:hypothetical protein L484_020312 [Morus notabilis]|uniref:Uncharacterized protein n=1 Tax=Morus notabilis TaxID=981085 RepID=W9R313_9ROSA|nr:hypothetical protein L484_020312 [Morus notabilis]